MAGVAGQGRRFSVPGALEAATLVFWHHGYEGTSLKMLTQAMGINPPSLYKAFGSKEDLFFRVIEHYNSTYGKFFDSVLDEDLPPPELLHQILHSAADHYTNPEFPGGCLTISAATTVTPENSVVAERLAKVRKANVARIEEALQGTARPGDPIPGISAATIASFIGATMQGMSQQARDGADSQQLHAIADLALRSVSASG